MLFLQVTKKLVILLSLLLMKEGLARKICEVEEVKKSKPLII